MLLQFDKNLKKAYILIITCSLSRAVHKVKNWKNSLRFKRFVARRGRPQKVYSDNAKTFKAAADWVKAIIKSERFQDYLSESCIKWKFNISRAPWWGGPFERMVRLMKQCLYKSVGKANLKWNEFEEILLDIENIK